MSTANSFVVFFLRQIIYTKLTLRYFPVILRYHCSILNFSSPSVYRVRDSSEGPFSSQDMEADL